MAEQYAEKTAITATNTAVMNVFSKEMMPQKDITTPNTTNSEWMETTDTMQLNYLKAMLDQAIQTELKQNEAGFMEIPLGSVLKEEAFWATGPNMKIRVHTSGVVHSDLKDVFTSVGINQVQHKIYLEITIEMRIISLSMHTKKIVTQQIPLTETIRSGKIPNYFAGNQSQIPSIINK